MSKFTKLNTVTKYKEAAVEVVKYIKTGTKRVFFVVEVHGKPCCKTLFARKYDAESVARQFVKSVTA